MANILYVVHRGYPFPGGSEYYVHNMAIESSKRGHQTYVLAHEHKGPQEGIIYTNDYGILNQPFDLIIVHGGECISQDIVHHNSALIKAPVCYMIIKPSESPICMHGLKHHRFLSYSTSADYEHIKKYGYLQKARRIRHGVVVEDTIIQPKRKSELDKPMFVSAGGFWKNKAMVPLAEAFEASNINGYLFIFGYDTNSGYIPKQSERIKVLTGRPKSDVMFAISKANAYIQNSTEEGFGLVLLEAMFNKTPWFARDIAGAHDMKDYGYIYKDEAELMKLLDDFTTLNQFHLPQHNLHGRVLIDKAYEYAMANHTIKQTVNDICDIILEVKGTI